MKGFHGTIIYQLFRRGNFPTVEIEADEQAPDEQPRRQLTDHERIATVSILLEASIAGPLPRGIMNILAAHLDVGRDAVGRLWRESKLLWEAEFLVWNEVLSKKSERGRKQLYDRDAVIEATINIPRKKRKNIRALAVQLGVPKSTVQRMRKEQNILVRHSSPIKPHLTEEHKVNRLLYALQMRNPDNPSVFQTCYDMVHIDKNGFS